jgi:hypothetical protein
MTLRFAAKAEENLTAYDVVKTKCASGLDRGTRFS